VFDYPPTRTVTNPDITPGLDPTIMVFAFAKSDGNANRKSRNAKAGLKPGLVKKVLEKSGFISSGT